MQDTIKANEYQVTTQRYNLAMLVGIVQQLLQ